MNKQKPLDPEVLRYWQGYFAAVAGALALVDTEPFSHEIRSAKKDAYLACNELVNAFADEADKPRRKAQKRKK